MKRSHGLALGLAAGLALAFLRSRRSATPSGPAVYPAPLRSDPPSDSPMRPEVREGFPAFTQRFEGRVPHMYLDVKGLVTTGVGNLIDPVDRALSLPWLFGTNEPADMSAIRGEWERVKALPAGKLARFYASSLHLDDATIDALVLHHLDADAAYLRAHAFPDFATFPAPAQTAILSMAWAMGAGWPSFARYADLVAAIRAGDWTRAADLCEIPSAGNAGVVPRNEANKKLFLDAAAGVQA